MSKKSFEQKAHDVFLYALEKTGSVGKAVSHERAWRDSFACGRIVRKTDSKPNKKAKLKYMELKAVGYWAHKPLISQFHKPGQQPRPTLQMGNKMPLTMRRLSQT